ncbi:MAG: COG3014 family protein [Kiritimatiellales bacterium]
MKRLKPGGVAFAALLLLTGCATHSRNAGAAMAALKSGNTTSALQWSEKLKTSTFSKDLGYLESGRIKMLNGDFTGSRADFRTAIDTVLEETETGPEIRLSAVGATLAASTVADDTIRSYELSPYEVIQLLHYQTLNYLFCGDPDGAGVEMRRTVFAQDALSEQYADEVQDAQEEQEKDAETRAKAMEAVNAKMEGMAPALERTSSSHENGLAWYLCGLMFEKQGDPANASLSYRKAWELAPQNPCILKDFLRMLQTQDRQAFVDLVLQNNADVNDLSRGSTEIVVLYEESLISQRQAEKIQLPIPDFQGTITMISVDFPFYSDPAYTPSVLQLKEDGGPLGTVLPAVYLQSLAYRDLKEKMPGIVIRNVTRAVTKVATQQVANQGNSYTKYGMMAFNAISSMASTADTRAWYSIPMATQLYRGTVEPGSHTLECRSPLSGTLMTIPLEVQEGETRLVWIADTGGMAAAATASLNRKGIPPTYQQFNNPFRTNGIPNVAGGESAGTGTANSKENKETVL